MPDWPFPAPHDDGRASHLVPGLPLPDIELPATVGDTVNLARAEGRSVVFIYPWTGRPGLPNPPGWDDIPGAHGSTPQVQGFRDLHLEFRKIGVSVFGVSGQTSADQHEFAQRVGLTFPLLSDADGEFQQALMLPAFETGGARYLARLTLIVTDGKISSAIYPVHPPDAHAGEVLRELSAQG